MVGVGSYGGLDFRALVAETHRGWRRQDARSDTVEDIAHAFADTAGAVAREVGQKQTMTVLVAGYSPDAAFGELWEVRLPEGEVHQRAKHSQTFVWRGQSQAVQTLWWGADMHALHQALDAAGVDHDKAHAVMAQVKERAAWGPERMTWGMPLSSAVDLVRFQLELQIAYERFMPGRGKCGPPTQIVAINDAGLRWMDNPFEAFSQVARTERPRRP